MNLGRWALGDCGNSVLIFIWQHYKKVGFRFLNFNVIFSNFSNTYTLTANNWSFDVCVWLGGRNDKPALWFCFETIRGIVKKCYNCSCLDNHLAFSASGTLCNTEQAESDPRQSE
jgi:hypothetical protein